LAQEALETHQMVLEQMVQTRCFQPLPLLVEVAVLVMVLMQM
jgi:hypothetical protein